MRLLQVSLAIVLVSFSALSMAKSTPDPARDILVTFDNKSAVSKSAGLGAPYTHRKRYAIARQVRRHADEIADEFSLQEIEHWPIRSLSIYCFVYRVPEGADRDFVIKTLNSDSRVESAQTLQSFETSMVTTGGYDDTYANLQYGLDILGIAAAHQTTRGAGVRIAIIDSNVDLKHEDLKGRIGRVRDFVNDGQSADQNHGTAIASVIGARSNNALGIVGIAPEATLELYVSCWSGGENRSAQCDTFSLSKALDSVLDDPPHVLNISVTGPNDPLLKRLIEKVSEAGVVVVASGSANGDRRNEFPSNLQCVIGVGATPTDENARLATPDEVLAPGTRILVATPRNQYDFRSGTSLAAAHVSGVAALLLSVAPNNSPDRIGKILHRSQVPTAGPVVSINACSALNLVGSSYRCDD